MSISTLRYRHDIGAFQWKKNKKTESHKKIKCEDYRQVQIFVVSQI